MTKRIPPHLSDPMRLSLVLLALAALGLPVAGRAGETTPAAWFARMQKTLTTQSYQGNIVYMGSSQPTAYQLVACSDGYARLSALSGPPREVIHGPHVAVRMRAGHTALVVHEMGNEAAPLPFPPVTRTPVAKLEHWYRFVLGGSNRVAGQAAQLVELVPRDRWRYGYRIWISKKSGMPLSSQLIGLRGGVLEQAFFTSIQLLDMATARGLIGGKALSLAAHAASAPQATIAAAKCPDKDGAGAVNLEHLPAGFELVSESCESAPLHATPVTHLLVSDGLTHVSVFVSPRQNGGATLMGETGMGPVHAVGRVAGGYAVTVLGTAPLATVSSIANGVRIKKQ
ncbi:MAG: MucB/RseB C-terminal domain-containing protein [Gammaproteobacteria bacterium]